MLISHRTSTRNQIAFVESDFGRFSDRLFMNQNVFWIDPNDWIERAWLEILIALGWRLTFWLMIGCGLDEQPFNFMGRKLFNLPKNSFCSAKYANDLMKWHKLHHMISHFIIRYTTFPIFSTFSLFQVHAVRILGIFRKRSAADMRKWANIRIVSISRTNTIFQRT